MIRSLPLLCVLAMLAAPAWAQTVAGMAPKVEKWPAVVFAAVLFACVFAISIMSSRRTHLD